MKQNRLTPDEKTALLRDYERLKNFVHEDARQNFIQQRLNEIEQQHGDIERVRDMIASVRRFFDAGDFILAAGASNVLEQHINRPLIETGIKMRAAREHISVANATRHDARTPVWALWQNEAKEIWNTNPNFSKTAVASNIKQKLNLNDSVRTIRQRISK